MSANRITVTNENGMTFNVQIVLEGESYGLEGSLTAKADLIEFYDARYEGEVFGEMGQFVSRYYVETIREHGRGVGLDLDGGVADWTVDAEAMDEVIDFVLAA